MKNIPNRSGIYKWTNVQDDKVYVGSSKNMRTRKNSHLSCLRRGTHSTSYFQNAFNKHGEESFEFSIIEYCDEDYLAEREAFWIMELKANNRDYGYNARIYVTTNLGYRHTEELKQRISDNRRGKGKHPYNLSDYDRQARSERCKQSNPGRFRTRESYEKAAAMARGSIISNEHKEAISKNNRGEGNGQSKLTEEKVIEIKKLLAHGELSQTTIASEFGVSRRTIGLIRSGERWSYVNIEATSSL